MAAAAAMMLPAAAPVVLAVDRRTRRSGRPTLATIGFIAGYLADWAVTSLGAYAVALVSRGRLGSVQAGVRHGAFCLGCCWSLMLVLVLLGMMNLAWMALVAAVMSAERLLPFGRIVAAIAATALIASRAVLFAVPHLLTD